MPMRLIYSLVWYLALPIVLVRLWLRGRQEPGYRAHIAERFGFYNKADQASAPTIWVHAVSAGETRAAEPLVRALLERYPTHHIVLSHMTATGRSTSAVLFKDVQARITAVFLPYDLRSFIHRFLTHFSPQICILIETEVWPNLVAQCQYEKVPVTLVNARLSKKSLRKALRFPSLILPAVHGISAVAAQSQPDAERLRTLGIQHLQITGNIKFDVTPPTDAVRNGQALRRHFGQRALFLCASTRDGEEALILDAFVQHLARRKDILLIITPRHPQRFDDVVAMIEQRKLRFVRRSNIAINAASDEQSSLQNETQKETQYDGVQVVLGDSMGEMYMYYASCDVAFIGGSLMPLGGHNLIEACAMGKPVLTGPHTFNFSEITNQALAANAAVRIHDAADLMRKAAQLIDSPESKLAIGGNAQAFFQQHQGATQRTMQLLSQFL